MLFAVPSSRLPLRGASSRLPSSRLPSSRLPLRGPAVGFLLVVFRAAGFAVVLFAVVLVPFSFVGMVASLVTLTLGSTCLGDHRRRGDAPWATVAIVISAAETALFGSLLFPAQGRPASCGRLVLAAQPQGVGVTPVTT